MKRDGRKGHLFVLEGIDGSGKTTVCDLIQERLQMDGIPITRLREPTNESEWGKQIRERSPLGELSPEEELELFINDRAWNIENRINPAMKRGETVLLDRYFFATGAYQSVSTGIPWQEILKRNREEIGSPEPDIVFILDLTPAEGLRRATSRKGTTNLQFETMTRLVGVRTAYLEMVNKDDIGNYIVVDASLPLEIVVDIIYTEISTYFP